MHFNCF